MSLRARKSSKKLATHLQSNDTSRTYLSTSTLAILSTFNDTGQIQQLDFCAFIFDAAGNLKSNKKLLDQYVI